MWYSEGDWARATADDEDDVELEPGGMLMLSMTICERWKDDVVTALAARVRYGEFFPVAEDDTGGGMAKSFDDAYFWLVYSACAWTKMK